MQEGKVANKIIILALLLLVLGPWVFGFLAWKWVFASTTISNPTASSCHKGGTSLNITWSSTDSPAHYYLSHDDGTGYPVYPEEVCAKCLAHPYSSTSYPWTLPSVTSSLYQVYVEAHPSGHTPYLSNALSGTFSIDSAAPTAPTPSSPSHTSTTVDLSWTASTDAGCKGLSGYRIYRDGSQIAIATGTTYQDTGRSPSKTYAYKVAAYDDFHSTDSNTINVTTDASPPPPPPPPPPGCSCGAWSAWKNGDCGGGSCPSEKRNQYRTRICSPAGCDIEIQGQCVEDSACLPPPPAPPPPSPSEPVRHEISVAEIRVGEETFDPSEIVRVEEGETIELSGTTAPNATVFIFVTSETKIYTAGADDTGDWVYAIHTSEFEPGIHVVEVQSEKDGARSERLKIFSFEVLAAEEVPVEPPVGKLPYQWVIVGIVMAVAVSVVGYVLWRRAKS